ncbi:MAG: MBL fold metallo-hydrolase [Lachnospiraceae bacterium]|nr:MBL fold metallo-hydrolase [Lachnospiraceae bacterium]
MKKISETIEYIETRETPLSAEVVFVHGDGELFVFDAGCGEEVLSGTLDMIKAAACPVSVILSHFHTDHVDNVAKIPFDRLYVSGYTAKQLSKKGYISEDDTRIVIAAEKDPLLIGKTAGDEEVVVRALPSSHSKGGLMLEAGRFAFLGDGAYPMYKNDERVYNNTRLREEIDALKQVKADTCYLSHEFEKPKTRIWIVNRMQIIYSHRDKDSAFVPEGKDKIVL